MPLKGLMEVVPLFCDVTSEEKPPTPKTKQEPWGGWQARSPPAMPSVQRAAEVKTTDYNQSCYCSLMSYC